MGYAAVQGGRKGLLYRLGFCLGQKLSAASSWGRAPRVRSRRENSSSAERRSVTVKSGQRFSKNTNSAKALSHRRKSERRCSPPVRISRSTSLASPREISERTAENDSTESSVAL